MPTENGTGNVTMLWRVVGVAAAIAGGAAAGLGSAIVREPQQQAVAAISGGSIALESRVRANAEEIAGLKVGLAALTAHIESLSGERERRFQTLEGRVDALYERVRILDARR